MSSPGFFGSIAAGTAAVVGIGMLVRRRRKSRLPQNTSGIADASLSVEERRAAAEEFQRLPKEEGGETA